jgi:hypothetical protein
MFQGGRKGKGKGVVTSFHLESKNIGSYSFLQVGSYKSGGFSLLPVGASFMLEHAN